MIGAGCGHDDTILNLAMSWMVVQVLGVDDVIGFDYFEAPSQEQLQEALLLLHSLGALDDHGKVRGW